ANATPNNERRPRTGALNDPVIALLPSVGPADPNMQPSQLLQLLLVGTAELAAEQAMEALLRLRRHFLVEHLVEFPVARLARARQELGQPRTLLETLLEALRIEFPQQGRQRHLEAGDDRHLVGLDVLDALADGFQGRQIPGAWPMQERLHRL